MNDEQLGTLEDLQGFLDGTVTMEVTVAEDERYAFIARTVKRFGYGTEGKHLCLCHVVIGRLAVTQDTMKLRNLSDPAAINLFLAFDAEIHD